jgi:hypothetical protein
MLTKKAEDRKQANSGFSGIMRKSVSPKQTTDAGRYQNFWKRQDSLSAFYATVVLSNLDGLAMMNFPEQRLPQDYWSNTVSCKKNELPMLKDIHLKDRFQIGDQHAQLFTLGDAEDLPALCGSRITYDKYSTDKTNFPLGFAAQLNLLLDCNHIYNQYFFIGDTVKRSKNWKQKN